VPDGGGAAVPGAGIHQEMQPSLHLLLLGRRRGAGAGVVLEELVAVIEQARQLGARRIILLGGGEPLLFPAVKEIIRHIDALGLSQAIFTNGICLDKELCRFLFDHRATVAVKQNSFRAAVQDELAGTTGAYAGIQRGLRLLMESGYPDADRPLCVQSVICRPNRTRSWTCGCGRENAASRHTSRRSPNRGEPGGIRT